MIAGHTEHEAPAYGEELVEVSPCRHHWVIDSPEGPISKGICRLCGMEKEFRNSLGDSYWDQSLSLEGEGFGDRYPISVADRYIPQLETDR